MTSSTVTLRIQELVEAQGLTFEELSKASGVSLEDIQAYATTPVELIEETATALRKIATKLNVAVVELVQPIAKREAFKLKILEMAQQKGLTLEKLSERSGVNPAIISFYSTQSISNQKLNELESKNQYLRKISQALVCDVEDLKIEAELPTTKLCVEEWVEERGLNLQDLSRLTNLPQEYIDLIAKHPLDVNQVREGGIAGPICTIFPNLPLCKK